MDKLTSGYKVFETKDGEQYYFIRVLKCGWIYCFSNVREGGIHRLAYDRVHPKNIDKDILKSLKVWNKIPNDVKKEMESEAREHDEKIKQRLEHVRSKRKKKYAGLPEMLKCKCGKQIKANYSNLQKKADAKNIPLEDVIKGYKCQKCNPTKGRKKK